MRGGHKQMRRFPGRLRPLLVDAIAPIALYYGLRAAGVGDLPALLAGGGIAAVDALVSLAVERRPRPLPLFVCAMFAVSGALAFVLHDPRVVLLKPSVVSLGFGLYLLTLSARRDLRDVLLALGARGGDEARARFLRAWEAEPSLRRNLRAACAIAGLMLMAEAAARTAIVLTFPISQSVLLAHAPALLLIPSLFMVFQLLLRPALVRARTGRTRGDGESSTEKR
jgi:hypothetical protein